MTKFLNKKEQVYDLQLTSYGKYLLSIGRFKPVYYAFFDDNVLYDKTYTTGSPALATYSQVSFSTSDLASETIILEDATGTTHEMTFRSNTDLVDATTSTNILIEGLINKIDIAEQIEIAINLAKAQKLIDMTVVRRKFHLTLVMDALSADGNGKTITGTTISKGYATVTSFAGGSNLQYESQNDVYARIKDETQYLESFVLFRDLDDSMSELKGGYEDYAEGDEITPIMSHPAADIFRFNRMIGDAWLDGDTNKAPAWKIVSLQSKISSSAQYETGSYTQIPQVNYNLTYTLSTQTSEFVPSPNEIDELEETTLTFIDGDVIALESDNPLLYVEEANTELLTENFDIEVFMVTGSENRTLERKYFENEIPQIVNGMLISETPQENLPDTFTTNSVEYYFDILTDTQINSFVACRGAEIFNKKSYYVDLDFDCDETQQEDIFFDIYGSVTEPEICLD